MSLGRVLLLLLNCVLFGAPAAAQVVTGTVTDAQGSPVAQASVSIADPSGPASAPVRTEADGTFHFNGVVAGVHILRVEADGFQRWTQTIVVDANTPPISVVLPVPGFAETVAVAAPRLEEDLPQELERTGVRVQTISSAQIENGGYVDVAQALQSLVPGLFLAPKAGAFDYVAVALEGSRRNEVLWLLDGVRISNRLYNGTTPLDTIPAHMVERIEIIEGGQGLFYGTQAVAGAINVVTKVFADVTNGRVHGGFDSNDGKHLDAFARTSHRGNRFVAYGSRDSADGFRQFPDDQYADSTSDRRRSYDVSTLGTKYAYDFGSLARLSAMYQFSDAQLDNLRPARSSPRQAGGLNAAYNARTEQVASVKLDVTPRRDLELFVKA